MMKKGISVIKTAVNPLLVVVFMAFASACEQSSCREVPDISASDVEAVLTRLEEQMVRLTGWQETEQFLKANRVFAEHFYHANQYPHDSILAKRIFRLLKAPSIDTLFMEVKDKFQDMDGIVDDYERAYQIINYYYPNTTTPELLTAVTAFYNDLYISDSKIIVGLDYFLGPEATFKPQEPAYILKRFRPESIVPTVMNFVSNNFNKIDRKHNTLLSDMVNIGKSYYFTSQVLPCTPDSLIIGYTPREMRLVRKNQEIIWANLIENELLYETSDYMKNKFVGEVPNVFEISKECPGRVGAWIGWEIVKKYMQTTGKSLTELMAENDAYKIFQKANYRPKNE